MEQQKLEGILRTLASDVPDQPDVDYFRRLTVMIAQNMGVEHAFIAHNGDDVVTFTRAYDFYYNQEFMGPMEYKLADTPCDDVINAKKVCHYPIKVQELFPHDEDLKTLKVQGYAGAPVTDVNGKSIGHIVLLSSGVLKLTDLQKDIFKLYAMKVATAMERMESMEITQQAS